MSEFDDLIHGALDDFRDAEAGIPAVTPGTAAVRATVKRRRAVRFTTLSVLGALLIVAPIAAFAADPHGNNPPPNPAGSVTSAPTPTPVGSDPAGPSTAPPTATPPDGVISVAQLRAVKVDFSAFQVGDCPTKAVTLLGSAPANGTKAWVTKVVHTNLDADPALETAALILCRLGETPESQVIAFDRDASGAIVTLGTVISEGPRANVRDITARDGGGVVADVSDTIACCGSSPDDERHQQREYGWDGTKFRQLAGPTAFGDPARVTDLRITVTAVTLGPVTDGRRTGTATVTVKNNGPKPSGRFRVNIKNCSFACNADPAVFDPSLFGAGSVPHAPLPAGEQISMTMTITVVDPAFTGGTFDATVEAIGLNDRKGIDDLHPADNTATVRIRVS
ncbi:hypothetical protein ACFPIJ_27760 [Dactylosporangium cerinum]|uniref:DUF11 domain-containing protein n=1 Tax=Dactylosporangium cerinum TaxID=1434730 RepID=A0ABV9W0P3_9ACTN